MENLCCKNCKHYIQHYGLDEKGLFRLNCGHCASLRANHKYPDQKACKNFIPGENRENAFASQEYLTKALLDKALTLPLLFEELQNCACESDSEHNRPSM